jgi:transposase InsO family protein
MAAEQHNHRIQPLNGNNYTTWSEEMKALLRSKGLWRLVDGKEMRPSTPAKEQEAWDIKQDRAAGELMLNLMPDQRVHIRDSQDDPTAAWKALAALFVQQKASTRFVAYEEFFSIRKRSDESLPALSARVEQAMARIQELRPISFDLKTSDAELSCMAMMHALGPEYSHFTSSLALLTDLDKDKVKAAFQTEEINRRPRSDPHPSSGSSALSTSTSSCSCNPSAPCAFCDKTGHCQCKCYSLQRAKDTYKSSKRTGRRPNQANTTSAGPAVASASPTAANATQDVVERAGNASFRSMDPSDPLSPLQLDADVDWNADTGATSHMTPHRHWLRNYSPKRVPIKLADNTVVYSAGVGSVVFHPTLEGKRGRAVEFSNVLHVPQLRNNLLAVLYLTRRSSFDVHINATHMSFSRSNGPPLFVAPINEHNAAFLDGVTEAITEYASPATTVPLDLALWHRRLAHHNLTDVKALIERKLVTGMQLDVKTAPDPLCEPCLAGKMHANPFPSSSSHASRPLELVHSDVHAVPYPTFSGYRYWVTFIDDYSRYRFVLPIRAKSDVFDAFKQFKAFAENQTERRIKTLRDDKGGEYMSNAMLAFTNECGIERQHTVRARPQQNGVAERANRVLSERITAMLQESGLAMAFWGEALAALVHVWNRCPTAALDSVTPYELWNGRKPDVSHLRVWGCTAYVHIQRDKRPALRPHYEKCVFIGYPEGYKGWKFYNPTTKRTVISERADFDERLANSQPTVNASNPPYAPPDLPGNVDDEPVAAPEVPPPQGELLDEDDDEPAPLEPAAVAAPAPPVTPPPRPRSPIGIGARLPVRNRQKPRDWWKLSPAQLVDNADDSDDDDEDADAAQAEECFAASSAHPRSLADAMHRPDASEWKAAALLELDAHKTNGTWILVPRPRNRPVIGSRWIFTQKYHADGSFERYKGRLVAQGFSQRPGFEYLEVFAPTVRLPTLRIILALAALHDLHLWSVDVSNAYLNGDMDCDVYMEQPEGFAVGNPKDIVCLLKKSLYGTKQGGNRWNRKMRTTLESMGFKQTYSDAAVYIFVRGDVRIILPVFVDDMTFASTSLPAIKQAIADLSTHFKLRDLGPTTELLAIKIDRNRTKHSLTISQPQYCAEMLSRYGMGDSKPVSTPMTPGLCLSREQSPRTADERAFMRSVDYGGAIGSLQYLSCTTRPDIAYTVGQLASFTSDPGVAHWHAIKHLLRYIKGTMDYAITYAPDPSMSQLFTTYSDANHGGCKDTGRSTGAYIVKIGSGVVSWQSKRQSIVALSTTEAEYMAACEAGKEIVWMRKMLQELGFPMPTSSVLYMDNQSAIQVAKHPEHHGRMKQLDLSWFWLRDVVDQGTISPTYVPTGDMTADLLTKALPRLKVEYFCQQMGLGRSRES